MEEHIKYETAMMTQGAHFLRHGANLPTDGSQQFWWNVILEDFDIHARNLIAYHNITGPEIDRYLKMVDDQILTLTPARTAVMAEKIQVADRLAIFDIIDRRLNAGT